LKASDPSPAHTGRGWPAAPLKWVHWALGPRTGAEKGSRGWMG
jgi:hypothetical protein